MRTALALRVTVVQRLSRTLLQLNIATRRHHDAADAPWLDLMVPSVDAHDYVEHLVKIYGFEAPLESALRYTPGLSTLIDLRSRTRTGLLAQDLMRLGMSASQIAKLPQRFIAFSDAVDALGWMYVVERSALRHGGVLRYLLERLPEIHHASSYLAAYDAATGNRWSELGTALDSVGDSASVVHQLARAANQGFQALRDWFSDGDSGVRESMIRVDTEPFAKPYEKRRRHR
ncbi:MAG TPA: biliverdin-producing heme oxygenase [Kofleriaceae bacterium]|nr:biliverdin-producing heme oxygenase [Kofleriaceae bacterium]